jgi:hypothetical protein
MGLIIMPRRMKRIVVGSLILVFISLINTVPTNASETAESIAEYTPFFISNLNLISTNEKIPHLLETEWDQAGKYAMYTPAKIRVGCWSTAIAQILYFHKLLPNGKVCYRCSEGYQINENLESYKFEWNQFVKNIDDATSKESLVQVAKYSYFTAVVIQKDFGTGSYIMADQTYKKVLEKHFRCIVKEYYFTDHSFDKKKSKIVKLIINEINALRPVMLYFSDLKNVTHAVVIDGYSEKKDLFWVHINQGLGGEGNGSYNLFDSISRLGDDMEFRFLLTIKPKKQL